MRVLRARNVHSALPRALHLLGREGVRRDSRNGPVIMHPEPVCTVYEKPTERVLFHEWRDANPFFHFYESLWMLAGRNDVAPLARYVPRMVQFSDDGKTFNAAYGRRWRRANRIIAEFDQLRSIVSALRENRDDRRQVLYIANMLEDCGTLVGPTKDQACNLTATFQVAIDGRLDMTVFCRSNDVIWGCYGANAVHFSMLHEYIASHVGVPVGLYRQISVNWHLYEERHGDMLSQGYMPLTDDQTTPYSANFFRDAVSPYPIVNIVDQERWDYECREFVSRDDELDRSDYRERFFRDVAWPIVAAHDYYKLRAYRHARQWLEQCEASDWRLACQQWLDRREHASSKTPKEEQ